jgi:hypothetical protein
LCRGRPGGLGGRRGARDIDESAGDGRAGLGVDDKHQRSLAELVL